MYCKQPLENPSLETLQDERDHLTVQLSLAKDNPAPDEDRIKELRKALSDVESRIRHHRSPA